MLKLKIVMAVIMLSFMLSLGNPLTASASGVPEMPPAIVFVQNGNSGMELKHNFTYDNGIFKTFDTSIDKGFYITPGK